MLIRTFRSSYLFQYLLLIVISGTLWLPSFLAPPPLPELEYSVDPLFNIIAVLLSKYPLLGVILGYILLLSGGFLLNVVMISHDLVSNNSLLPTFIYSVLMSIYIENLTITPCLFSAVFLILALNILFKIYELSDTLKSVLSVGLLFSIGSMFNFPGFILILYIFISLIIARIGTWRDWIVPIIGFIIPYLYLWTYYFLTDHLHQAYETYSGYFTGLSLFESAGNIYKYMIEGSIFVLLIIPAIFGTLSALNTYNIATRKRLLISLWLFIFGILMALMTDNYYRNPVYLLAGTIFISHRLDNLKPSRWREIVILTVVIAIAVSHFIF